MFCRLVMHFAGTFCWLFYGRGCKRDYIDSTKFNLSIMIVDKYTQKLLIVHSQNEFCNNVSIQKKNNNSTIIRKRKERSKL